MVELKVPVSEEVLVNIQHQIDRQVNPRMKSVLNGLYNLIDVLYDVKSYWKGDWYVSQRDLNYIKTKGYGASDVYYFNMFKHMQSGLDGFVELDLECNNPIVFKTKGQGVSQVNVLAHQHSDLFLYHPNRKISLNVDFKKYQSILNRYQLTMRQLEKLLSDYLFLFTDINKSSLHYSKTDCKVFLDHVSNASSINKDSYCSLTQLIIFQLSYLNLDPLGDDNDTNWGYDYEGNKPYWFNDFKNQQLIVGPRILNMINIQLSNANLKQQYFNRIYDLYVHIQNLTSHWLYVNVCNDKYRKKLSSFDYLHLSFVHILAHRMNLQELGSTIINNFNVHNFNGDSQIVSYCLLKQLQDLQFNYKFGDSEYLLGNFMSQLNDKTKSKLLKQKDNHFLIYQLLDNGSIHIVSAKQMKTWLLAIFNLENLDVFKQYCKDHPDLYKTYCLEI